MDVNPGAPSQVVQYDAITATSDCPGAVNISQIQGLTSGSPFPLGNTVVQFMAMDACGSMESCDFNVTLNTIAASTTITCPDDITVNAAPSEVGATVTFSQPMVGSDCFIGNTTLTLVSALASGDQFPLLSLIHI